MIRRWRSIGYGRAGGTSNDTDGLQTDVMRFMSILGICLMAVFALVQSLPLHDTEPAQEGRELSPPQDNIDMLQLRKQSLEKELQHLQSKVAYAADQIADKERALSEARQQLTAVAARLDQARSDQQLVNDERIRLQQRIAHDRDAAAALKREVEQTAQLLGTMQDQLQRETQVLSDVRARTNALKGENAMEERRQERRTLPRASEQEQPRLTTPLREREKADELAKTMKSQSKTAPASVSLSRKTKPEKRGFTLRFASDEALQNQLIAGNVQLFAMAERQAWRLTMIKRKPTFKNAPFPSWFHEMAKSTVPAEYLARLMDSINPKAHEAVVWGVQLPPTTKQDIAELTRGRKGGDLVIAADGRVRLTGG